MIHVRPGRSALGALRDNVEAIAFALVMALLLRHFCVEVFKIPTASMYPTLRGDEPGKGTIGDRIVVDKWAYLWRGPQRWDVPVFRFPLDRSRNFIKRVAFLPGEEGRMERGDLWVRRAGTDDAFVVARKPRDVRETLYVPVYPPQDEAPLDLNAYPHDRDAEVRARLSAAVESASDAERQSALASLEEDFALAALPVVHEEVKRLPPTHAAFRAVSALDARLSERARLRYYWRPAEGVSRRWRLEGYGRFAFAGGEREAIAYAFGITDSTHALSSSRSTSGSPVVDVRVRFSVEAWKPGVVEVSWAPGDGRRAMLRLASEGSVESSALVTGQRTSPLSARLVVGRKTAVELEYVDGDARAWVDGSEVGVLPDDLSVDEATSALDREDGAPQELRLEAAGGALVLTDLRVDRDLYYLSGRQRPENEPGAGRSVVVPEDSYFMLGDNTGSSHDSRQWRAEGVRLKPGRPDDLTEIWWDSQNDGKSEPTDGQGAKRTVTDLDGVERVWNTADELEEPPARRIRFVTRDMMVGRAFFALVFWPLEDVPRRFRLIH